MGKKNTIGMPWEFAPLFNAAIECLPERPMQPRSYCYASEMGGCHYTRYLKMNAHPFSNPYNIRSRRKMIAGTIFEWIVQFVLTSCGVMQSKQERVYLELPGMLPVSGKIDFVAGGLIDWGQAKEAAERMKAQFGANDDDKPPIVVHSVDRILFRMEQIFSRVPLTEKIVEVKSVSGFVGDLIERSKKPRQPHPLQLLTYAISKGIPGMLTYVNRDSLMIYEFDVSETKELRKQYISDLSLMTDYMKSAGKNYLKNLPPKPAEVLFEEASFRFVKSNQTEYSPYLSMMYPKYRDFEDFKKFWAKPLLSFNRVFKRCVNGENLTAANKDIIAEAKKIFPDWDKYVAKAKKAGAFETPEETEDEG